MKTIKDKYFAIIILIILAYILNLRFNFIPDEKVNLLLGFIALIISIISLGIADSKQSKLKIKLKVWNRNNTKFIGGKTEITNFAFELINKGKDAIEGLTVSFRFQESAYYKPSDNYQNNYYFKFGERIVVQNDTVKYLGITTEDNYIRYEHYIKEIDTWNKGKIAITIGGNDYLPYTFLIDHEEKDIIKNSSNSNPITYNKL